MKFIAASLALLLSAGPALSHPCFPKKPTTTPCKPETLRIEREVVRVVPAKPQGSPRIEKRERVGPWIALGAGIVAGAILVASNQRDEHRCYVTVQPPACGGKKH